MGDIKYIVNYAEDGMDQDRRSARKILKGREKLSKK